MANSIIHPTDFSTCANHALDYAILVARALNLKISLVHALDSGNLNGGNHNAQTILEKSDAIKQEATKKLAELAEKVQGQQIECTTEIFNGKLSSWLPNYVNKINPGFVIMGTTGASNIASKIMGSTTFSIIKSVNFPLLAVPLNAKISPFRKIIFSTDYRDADIAAILTVIGIASYYDAEVEIIHILNKETAKRVNNEKLLENLHAQIEKQADYAKVNYQLALGEDVHERLQILTQEIKPDFLALVMRKQNFFERLFFGSLTEKLVHHSEIPVFIFPCESE
jgi:nucleotide-binding universal stress UspA family protein